MTPRITLLPQSAYFMFLTRMNEGRQALTHAALFRIDGKTSRYYVKCYGNAAKPLFNEIAGYLLARAAGLPQAEDAALIALPGYHLDRVHPGYDFDSQENWLCWATSAISAPTGDQLPSATTHFNGQLADIAADLKQWPQFPNLLAFDEWVANIDRNTGNLIRRAEQDYAIIDHGAILSGPDWEEALLAPVASYINKMWSLLRGKRGLPLPISNGAIHASKEFINAYMDSGPELRAYGQELLTDTEVSACDGFLRDRTLSVRGYLQHRLGVLL